MSDKIVSAFPLPPPGWREQSTSYIPPEIPTGPFNCFGFEYNAEIDGSMTDTVCKTKIKENFEQAVNDFRDILLSITEGPANKEKLDDIEASFRQCLQLADYLGRLEALSHLEMLLNKI